MLMCIKHQLERVLAGAPVPGWTYAKESFEPSQLGNPYLPDEVLGETITYHGPILEEMDQDEINDYFLDEGYHVHHHLENEDQTQSTTWVRVLWPYNPDEWD